MALQTSENVSVAATFDAMGLKEDLLRGIYAYSKLADACHTELMNG
jgi:ATP-dependent RNA helicase